MPIRRTHHCPKCHYDLRGIIRSWTDHCPLKGRCPECGFEIGWGALLAPLRRPPPGFDPRRGPKIDGWLMLAGVVALGCAVIGLIIATVAIGTM